MAATDNRQRRHLAKLDRILDQAMSLLAAEGTESLTLNRVAESLSLTPAALYRYVASKDELIARLQAKSLTALSELIVHCRQAWARSAIVHDAPAPLRPLIGIVSLGRLYVRLWEDDSPHMQLMATLMGDRRPVLADNWAAGVTPRWMILLGHVAELLEQAETLGTLSAGEPMERAALLWASLHGAAQTHKLRRLAPDVFDVRTMVREVSAALALRWGATAADVEAALAASDRLRIRLPG